MSESGVKEKVKGDEEQPSAVFPGAFSVPGIGNHAVDGSCAEQEPDPQDTEGENEPIAPGSELVQATLVEEDNRSNEPVFSAKLVPTRNRRPLFVFGFIFGLVLIVAAIVVGVVLSQGSSSGGSLDVAGGSGDLNTVFSHHVVVSAAETYDHCTVSTLSESLTASEVNITCGQSDLLLFHQDNMECTISSNHAAVCRSESLEPFTLVGFTCAGTQPADLSVTFTSQKAICNTEEGRPITTDDKVVVAFTVADLCGGTFTAQPNCTNHEDINDELTFCVQKSSVCSARNCDLVLEDFDVVERRVQCTLPERGSPPTDFSSLIENIDQWIQTAGISNS